LGGTLCQLVSVCFCGKGRSGFSFLLQPPHTGVPKSSHANNRGRLQTKGFCRAAGDSKLCTQFAVVVGLRGSLEAVGDAAYLNDAVAFMNRKPPADEQEGAFVSSWFWGSYYPDTLLAKSSLSWQQLEWLQDNLGLKPWYQ